MSSKDLSSQQIFQLDFVGGFFLELEILECIIINLFYKARFGSKNSTLREKNRSINTV